MSKKTFVKKYGEQVAERDGGWVCHYCGIRLLSLNEKGCAGYSAESISLNGVVKTVWTHKADYDYATIDHVKPRKEGGDDNLDNLVLACYLCNTRRNTKPYQAFKGAVS